MKQFYLVEPKVFEAKNAIFVQFWHVENLKILVFRQNFQKFGKKEGLNNWPDQWEPRTGFAVTNHNRAFWQFKSLN